MHILGLLLGLIGTVGFLLWRMHMASEAAKGLVEAADDIRGLLRRRSWNKKANVNPLDEVDDARLAATAMMASLAQADGAMTGREEDEILGQLRSAFDADAETAVELLAYGKWLVRDTQDASNCFRKLKSVFLTQCGPDEREELLGMLASVVAAGGRSDGPEALLVEQIKHELDVRGGV